jgi:hypothetical protein
MNDLRVSQWTGGFGVAKGSLSDSFVLRDTTPNDSTALVRGR